MKLPKSFLFKKTALERPHFGPSLATQIKKFQERRAARAAEKQRRKAAELQRKLIAKEIKKEPEEEDRAILIAPQKKKRHRWQIKELLTLGGLNPEPWHYYSLLFKFTIFTMLGLTALSLTVGYIYNYTFTSFHALLSYVGFIAAFWTVGFAAVLLMYSAAFAIYVDLRINNRRKQIEAVFPDFLQLAAANLGAGMTIDRALWSAIRPRFGILALEMEDVAKKTMTGTDLEKALTDFSLKYDSTVIRRSISLIIEGIHSGGRMAEILNRIAVNIQENAILQKEMSANVMTYVIFISFASAVAAPFLFGLSTQLLIVIKTIAGSIAKQGSNSAGLSVNADVVKTSDFRIFAFVVLTSSSVMSASIVSVIRKGTIKDGFRLLPFFWVITIGLYFFATWVLGIVFSGLV